MFAALPTSSILTIERCTRAAASKRASASPRGRARCRAAVSIELEVKDEQAVAAAEQELRARVQKLLHATRKEPWGHTVCRLLTSESAIVGIAYAPSLHGHAR